ncbi:MAG: putative Ig domain-containing protein, partial [Bacteroidota bacterium]
DPPSFTSTPLTLIDEDDLYSYGITTQDPDDSDTRTIAALSKPNWLTITDNGDGTALLQGTPLNEDVGDHSVVLEVEDAVGAKAGQSFTITVDNVNDAPGFTSQPDLAAIQDQQYNYDITTSDPDVGDVLIIEATTLPAWLNFSDVGNGTAGLSGVPQNDDSGDHDVVLRVTDVAGAAVEQLFTISVGNTNDPPLFTSSPVVDATEDILYEYNIVTTDEDLGDTRNITGLSVPAWLSLVDNGNGTGRLAGVPDNDDVGNHPIVLRVTDAAGAETNQNFTITVANVNDQPVFSSTPLTTAQQGLEYRYDIITLDPDVGDSRFITATVIPSWLSLVDNGDGTATLFGIPSNSDLGSHSVTLIVEDLEEAQDIQSFIIIADNVNDPPSFTSVPVLEVDEDSNYQYKVEVTDPDAGDPLTLIGIGTPSWLVFTDNGNGTGTLTGIPENSDVGFHTIILQATDGAGQSVLQEFDIEVFNTNDAPVFTSTPVTQVNEDSDYEYIISVFDPDFIYGDFILLDGLSFPDWLEGVVDNFDGTWSLAGLPGNDDVGTFSITLVAEDLEGVIVQQNFEITVSNTNDDPVITSSAPNTVLEDSEYVYNILSEDVDVGDQLMLEPILLPGWVNLQDNGNGSGVISGIPGNEHVGLNTIIFQVVDLSGGFDKDTISLEVINTNDTPEFISEPLTQIQPGTVYEYTVTVEDVDENDKVTLEAVLIPSWLSFSLISEKTAIVTGTVPEFTSELRVLLQANDENGAVAQQDFNLIINSPPVLSDIIFPVVEDVNGILSANNFGNAFVDAEGDGIEKILIASLPTSGTLQYNGELVMLNSELDFNSNFQLIYVPNDNFFGSDNFSWNATDGLAYSEIGAQVLLNVAQVNDPPELANVEPETLVYSQGDAATAVTQSMILSDIDSDSITSATFQVVENFMPDEDILIYIGEDIEDLTFNYDNSAGILNITGVKPKSVYESVLRQIGYRNSNLNDTSPLIRRVAMLVNDGFDDSEIVFRSISIQEITPELDIVSAFTPNDDGVNDTWNILKLDFYTSVNVSVYSMDGNEVFSSNGYEEEWDGTSDGQPLVKGPYLYVIKVERNQREREFKGTVTILK